MPMSIGKMSWKIRDKYGAFAKRSLGARFLNNQDSSMLLRAVEVDDYDDIIIEWAVLVYIQQRLNWTNSERKLNLLRNLPIASQGSLLGGNIPDILKSPVTP